MQVISEDIDAAGNQERMAEEPRPVSDASWKRGMNVLKKWGARQAQMECSVVLTLEILRVPWATL